MFSPPFIVSSYFNRELKTLMSTMRKLPSEHPTTESASSSFAGVKTPSKMINSINSSSFLHSPATPLVPHTPSTPAAVPSSSSTSTLKGTSAAVPSSSSTSTLKGTPAAVPSSSSTSTLKGTSGAGTPSTPYRWNLGPVASSSKSAGKFIKGTFCVSSLSPHFHCISVIDYTVGASTSECGFNMQDTSRNMSIELPTLTILAIDEV